MAHQPTFDPQSIADKFWAHVDKTPGLGPKGECWEWRGARNGAGYGSLCIRSENKSLMLLAHRISLGLKNNAWPKLLACHICDNRQCVNPAHLFEGSHSDNLNDSYSKGRPHRKPFQPKTHCPHGHSLTPENIYLEKAGGRKCRICRREMFRRIYKRKRGVNAIQY